MFDKFKSLLGGSNSTKQSEAKPDNAEVSINDNSKLRIAEMIQYLDEPEQFFYDTNTEHPIHILAFGRDFAPDDDEVNEGYVLVTCGMSDRAMPTPENYEGDESPRIELIWYVRELNEEYIHNLRWLARLPHFDNFFLGSGHRVPMPEPILSFSDKTVFLTLSPIVSTDKRLLDDLDIGGHEIQTLCVHLLTTDEHALVKTDEGFNEFLDMMDENDYPIIFDPARPSYV